ncbi:zinc transporter, ZIP family [Tissierella praeacuta DSM 18095]|uniref:Zinc transporter, ZIP family n=1 Tax=Tissierella praeacuta DSM 18095 TaxID=1123404 RepID=A0A1M4VI56_9FIRM|nr:zinc transporter ZupT [Tissierella praeacuta]TCU79248.1 ZIP family zinc transporter [Tissierella praeacuta]SHE68711.1 zinc transporter, ZIP family [Tissierella praeacuta DSM 18095]SUO99125.1 Zinc transporter ZupT [Tissierella praeacuta]
MNKEVILSLGLTTIVGLSMGIGSLLSFFVKETNKRFLAIALSFSAGIMIYVSFMAILPEGMELIETYFGEHSNFIALGGFFGGMLITAIIEKIVHKYGGHYHGHDEHEYHHEENGEHLSKLGLMSAVAIAIHNLPEGLAIFTAGLKDISLAIPLAAAVILHNIPLSIAISVPIYYSTGSKKKAFVYSLLVGLCQPLGAIIGYLILSKLFNDLVFGILFSIVAGIMIFVSLDELLPSSQKYEDHHISVYGAIAGMAVMALSMSIFHHH